MLDSLKHKTNQQNSKFIKAVTITAFAIIILLNPWIAKWDENLDKELSKLMKKNPDKELVIQENQNDDPNLNINPNIVWWNIPSEQDIKNFFLTTRILETEDDRREFLKAWNNAKTQPNREPLWATIQDIYSWPKTDSTRLAVEIFALLDPRQETALWRQAFQMIENRPNRNVYWLSVCRLYVANLKYQEAKLGAERATRELEKVEELLEAIKAMTKIFEDYLKSNKILFFI